MTDKIYLGKDTDGEEVYVTKHSWDCGWYWSFGYLGNEYSHYHFDSIFGASSNWTDIEAFLSETKITQKSWWLVLEMFKTAYTFKEMAACMRRGSHISTIPDKYKTHFSTEEVAELNKKLELHLDNLWEYLVEITN